MKNFFTYSCKVISDFKTAINKFGWVVFENAVNPDLIEIIKKDLDNGYAYRRDIQKKNGISANMDGTLHHLLERDNFSLQFLKQMYCHEEINYFFFFIKSSFYYSTSYKRMGHFYHIPTGITIFLRFFCG